MLTGRTAAQNRSLRLDRKGKHARQFFLHISGDTSESTGGAGAYYDCVEISFPLLEKLFFSGLIIVIKGGRIIELQSHERAPSPCCKSPGLLCWGPHGLV